MLFIIMGAAAGAHAGWRGALLGAGVMLGVFGPMYLWGAHDRGIVSLAPDAARTEPVSPPIREDKPHG